MTAEALPTTTRAAVLTGLNQPLEILELELPPLKPGQLLVEVAYSGVCHSQLNEARGRKGADPYIPHAMGHEGAGRVLAVGEGVTKVGVGDAVILTWIKGQGADVPSTVYGSALGPVNSGAIATFMERCITCENRVVPLPEGLPLREAALLGCAVPTGGGVVMNSGAVTGGKSVAVFGVGGIGSAAVAVAAALGAAPLIAVDVVPEKLETARRFGASHTIDARSEDVPARIREIAGGSGVDLAVEAAGVPKVMEQAFASVRTGGGLCVLAGNVTAGETIRLDPYDLIKGRRLVGTWGGETQPDRDLPLYARMAGEGKLDLTAMIGRVYGLDEINQALDDLESGRVLRPIIAFRS
ncbi:S-(hydroxymethyl)glutathione dehydrogenase / alcohol dehydrogenase [Tistlia consotensis]|uniref:S-(Hydroxymethyl)glutathione dehydrogenase / alcohol dehydrogenase n=1 Tax=Tistlia consotensis USBA 355 TaxID=560819 RepID=A0A1Y6B8R0_9PROT|nr:zinc-binding dehydrogenase [Tistlia consotensis]SME98787.1 S-(hydroxymethyl)glutathione dehydrogenase / alcohol dehydrogenase [Tistlia consotensis USBA 355]SNR58195.1 S-(hydroxymethyl)glutathione dehydrogenase / alcohol dehydrogenase [Tistlia consotensis]